MNNLLERYSIFPELSIDACNCHINANKVDSIVFVHERKFKSYVKFVYNKEKHIKNLFNKNEKVIEPTISEYVKGTNTNIYSIKKLTNQFDLSDDVYFIVSDVPYDEPCKFNLKTSEARILSKVVIHINTVKYEFYFSTEKKSKKFIDDIRNKINATKNNHYNEFVKIIDDRFKNII